MSIVLNEISSNNPITSENVHSIAAELGVKVDESEVEVFSFLLAAAHDTFEELSALPDYHPETDTKTFPRRSVHPGIEDPSLGFPWSYRCDIKSQGPDSEDGSRAPPKTSLKLLSGQNVVVKDNICVAEIPQNNGTDAILPWIPQSDASVVRRILEAGGRIVGTATCEALSCATVSNTAAAGPIYNPLAKGYSAGGSSSGVAALVGRRQDSEEMADEALDIHMGLGADQGGSIRVPAAFCGLVGLKATHGLIPYTGVGNCEPTLDHVGPICRTVWDTALMLEAIAGSDDIDDRQVGAQRHGEIQYSSDLKAWYEKAIAKDCNRPLEGMRAGVIMEGSSAPFMKDEMKDELIRVVKQFEQLGAIVEDVSVPGHVTGRALWMAVCRQSLTSVALGNPAGRRGYYPVGLQERILPWNQEKWDKLPPGMRNEFINGIYEKNAFPTLYGKCMNMTTKLTREYEALFKNFDVLLLPTVPFTAPLLFNRNTASSMEQISATFGQTLNTMQFNLTGHPAMTIPTGLRRDMTENNPEVWLPVSVQIVGPLHGEGRILKFGYAYEQSFDWRNHA